MVIRFAVKRFHKSEVINVLRNVRIMLANPRARLAVLFEGERRFHQRAGVTVEYINADATISAEEKKNRIQMNEDARNQTFQQLFTEEQYNKYKMERMKTAPQRTEQRVAPANTRSKVENK